MAYTHKDHDYKDGTQALGQPPIDRTVMIPAESALVLSHDSFQMAPNAYDQLLDHTVQAYQYHGLAATLNSQNQNAALHKDRVGFASVHPEMHQMDHPDSTDGTQLPFEPVSNGQHDSMQSQTYINNSNLLFEHPSSSYSGNLAHHHHHHPLPTHHTLSEFGRNGDDGSYPTRRRLSASVVGNPDMPESASRPKAPKLKFTQEDDALLVELKETKCLTWMQIADFFPGRSSGTLQVRYCTKLKSKELIWTEPMVCCLSLLDIHNSGLTIF